MDTKFIESWFRVYHRHTLSATLSLISFSTRGPNGSAVLKTFSLGIVEDRRGEKFFSLTRDDCVCMELCCAVIACGKNSIVRETVGK